MLHLRDPTKRLLKINRQLSKIKRAEKYYLAVVEETQPPFEVALCIMPDGTMEIRKSNRKKLLEEKAKLIGRHPALALLEEKQ